MRTLKLLALIILVIAETPASQSPAQTQAVKRRVTIDSQTATSINYISALLLQAGMWGGIEDYRVDCSADLEFHLPSLDGTVEDALTQLRSQDNSLHWKVDNDGILVTRHAPANSLLDTQIVEFSFYPQDSAQRSADKLLDMPVVRDRINKLGATVRPPEIGFAQAPVDLKREDQVFVRNTSVRQALNAIASANHSRVWLFQQTTCGGQTTVLLQWLVK